MTDDADAGDRDADVYGSTDVTDDVEHHLGGVACALVGMQAFAAPEEPARHKVETIPPSPDGAGGVTLGVYSDGVAGRTILEPEQARALADRLAEAADELEQQREADAADTDTDDDGRREPTRSEPADFGGGESTGVQDL